MVDAGAGADEETLVAALRAGDERAFATLVDAYGPAMRRVALSFVRTPSIADEVVQDAWLGVLRGLDRFEQRSTLKTWLFRIVANNAKTRAVKEARSVPFTAFETDAEEPAVLADRFQGPGGRFPGGWVAFPVAWPELPESRLLAAETRRVISVAIEALPEMQRLVITLRDVEGWDSQEVCNVLRLTETNQRVLLHRARSKVRGALEEYLTAEGAW